MKTQQVPILVWWKWRSTTARAGTTLILVEFDKMKLVNIVEGRFMGACKIVSTAMLMLSSLVVAGYC